MPPRSQFRTKSRKSAAIVGSALALAAAAILAPGVQADLITPQAAPSPKPIVPQAVTPPPAPSTPAPSPPSSSTSGSSGQPAGGASSNSPSPSTASNGRPPAPHGPDNEPDYPDLPPIGEGCDVSCLEGWASNGHDWLLAYALTPLSEYNASDYDALKLIADGLKAIQEEIATALITGAHQTLTDPIDDGLDGSTACSKDETSYGDVTLCGS